MDPRRETKQIWKHFSRYQDDVGEGLLYHRFDADSSKYDDVYDEGFRRYHLGIRIAILWVDQSEAVEDYTPEGRRPTQRVRLAVSAREMYEAGVSVTEVHGNQVSDISPSTVWRRDRMHDLFFYDNRYWEVAGFQIRGRLQTEDVIIGISGIETFVSDDVVLDYFPPQPLRFVEDPPDSGFYKSVPNLVEDPPGSGYYIIPDGFVEDPPGSGFYAPPGGL